MNESELQLKILQGIELVQSICENKIMKLVNIQDKKNLIEMNISEEGEFLKFYVQAQYLRYKITYKNYPACTLELIYKDVKVKKSINTFNNEKDIEYVIETLFNRLYKDLSEKYRNSIEVKNYYESILYGQPREERFKDVKIFLLTEIVKSIKDMGKYKSFEKVQERVYGMILGFRHVLKNLGGIKKYQENYLRDNCKIYTDSLYFNRPSEIEDIINYINTEEED